MIIDHKQTFGNIFWGYQARCLCGIHLPASLYFLSCPNTTGNGGCVIHHKKATVPVTGNLSPYQCIEPLCLPSWKYKQHICYADMHALENGKRKNNTENSKIGVIKSKFVSLKVHETPVSALLSSHHSFKKLLKKWAWWKAERKRGDRQHTKLHFQTV